ncbi:FAD dependent oxidoreductase [Penicillium sp. IBT 18751x]|nr:FAD dependent oxidoreductase [Penicillium sp. IBT 18751x]
MGRISHRNRFDSRGLLHIETSHFRGISVRDLGFVFEPDRKTNLLKLCPIGGDYTNTDPKTGVSHAPDILKESALLPENDEKQLRKVLAQTLPTRADRCFVKKSLCRLADTNDSDFIVDYLPHVIFYHCVPR